MQCSAVIHRSPVELSSNERMCCDCLYPVIDLKNAERLGIGTVQFASKLPEGKKDMVS